MLFIDGDVVEDLMTYEDAIESVREAFRAYGSEKSQMPPKTYVFFEEFNGDFRVMPAYLEDLGAAGVKIVNVHPDNPRNHDLPSVMAMIVLLDPETGEPFSVFDGTEITDYRTGAAGAVAAEQLARDDSEEVGIIGTGAQARTQLRCLDQLFDLKKVKAYDKFEQSRNSFAEDMQKATGVDVEAVESPEIAVDDVDIVVTITPSTEPIIEEGWISDGTHVNAIGADAEGKQELEVGLLERSKILIDEWEQASHSGEISKAVSEGVISKEDIHGNIGEVITDRKPGRQSEDEVTIFDSTGLAVQDVSTAWTVYQKALESGKGEERDFLSLEK